MEMDIADIQNENGTKKRKIEEIAPNDGSVEEPPAKKIKFEENQPVPLSNDVLAYIFSFLPFPATFSIAAQLSRAWSKIVHSLEFLSHIQHLSFRLCRPYNTYYKARIRIFNMVTKCQNLEWLNLRNCHFTLDELLKLLAPIASKLQHLDISDYSFDDSTALVKLLKLCPNLVNLQAAKVRFRTPKTEAQLKTEVPSEGPPTVPQPTEQFVHPTLRVLSLHKALLPLDAMQQVLAATPNVVELDVWGTYIGPIAVVEALFSQRQFRSLDLTDVVVLENVAPWEKIFEHSGETLRALSLRRCLVVPEKFKLLMDQCRDLQEIDLWGNSTLTPETLASVTKFRGLKFLNLTECKVTDELVKKIAAECTVLEELSLRRCINITDETLALLVDGALHQTLTKLDLFDCHAVTDAGIKTLVSKCSKLKTLVVSDLAVTTDSLKTVLTTLPNLEELTFRRCKSVTKAGLVDALDGLQRDHVRMLDLSYTPALDDSIATELPKHFPNLVDLRLDSCPVSTSALVTCLEQLPHIKNVDLQYNAKIHDGTIARFMNRGIMKRLRSLKMSGCANLSDGLFYLFAGREKELPKLELFTSHLSLDLVRTLESVTHEKVEFSKSFTKKGTIHDVKQYASAVRGYHLVPAFIKMVMQGSQVPWYSSCPECNRRVSQMGTGDGHYYCEHCFLELDVPGTSYRMKMLIGDHTGQCYVTAFDSVGKKLFNRPAQELKHLYETNMREYDKALEQVTFIRHNFVITSALSDHTVKSVEEAEFIGESSCRIHAITELSKLRDRLQAAGLLNPKMTPVKGRSPSRSVSPSRSPPRSVSSTPQKSALLSPNAHASRPKSPGPAPSSAKRTLFPPTSPAKPKSPVKKIDTFVFTKEEPVSAPAPAPLDPAVADALEGVDMNDLMLTHSQELRLNDIGTGADVVKQEASVAVKQEVPVTVTVKQEGQATNTSAALKTSSHEEVEALLDTIKHELPADASDPLKTGLLPLSDAHVTEAVDMDDVLKFVESQHDDEPVKEASNGTNGHANNGTESDTVARDSAELTQNNLSSGSSLKSSLTSSQLHWDGWSYNIDEDSTNINENNSAANGHGSAQSSLPATQILDDSNS